MSDPAPHWDEARLKREHPFYGAVTGQALFYLLQEYEVDASRTQALLDEFEAGKQVLLELLNSRPQAIRLQAHEGACQACAALDGLVVPLHDPALPQWITLLPPFGLGCRLQALPALPDALLADAGALFAPPAALPRLSPLCASLRLE